MAHFYRGEMNRLTVWHVRLNTTTNWAILLTTGMTTFTLGSEKTPHYVLLLGLAIIGMCLMIEARRYRHVHHSAYRLRLLEAGYLRGELLGSADAAWREELSQDLAHPVKTISWLEAARVRLRRNYLVLVYFSTAVLVAAADERAVLARATSDGSERARKLPGRFSALRRMRVPDATISSHSRSYSSCELSHQYTLSGLHS